MTSPSRPDNDVFPANFISHNDEAVPCARECRQGAPREPSWKYAAYQDDAPAQVNIGSLSQGQAHQIGSKAVCDEVCFRLVVGIGMTGRLLQNMSKGAAAADITREIGNQEQGSKHDPARARRVDNGINELARM